MSRRTPHPSLNATAFRLIEDGLEWTETGIASALVQKFRDQGKRITERVREDCQDAARVAIYTHRDKIAAMRRGETFVNPFELYE